MTTNQEYTETEHELTHVLLTELLAHQFCSPVQWIDTQDVLLGDFSAERLIEIGPADTLVNMAKKTQRAGFQERDAALGLERQFLSYKKQSDAIYYQTEQPHEVPQPSRPAEPKTDRPSSPTTNQASVPQPAAVATPEQRRPVAISDQPISPSDVLSTLVSFTLKIQRDQVGLENPIKQLCGGRSTVQNEIIGDLSKEFGSLPDHAEDLSITELSAVLKDSGAHSKLGPCANSLVGKLVSAKMPAGSGVAFLRQHLETRWSLGPGLQDKVLLLAICQQPSSRLASEDQARSYLDGLVEAVLKDAGIDIHALSTVGATAPPAAVAVDPEALNALKEEHKAHDRRLMELYAKRSNFDISKDTKAIQALKSTINDLQSQLDSWTVEQGDAYAKGILPKFDELKVRKYDSYWNWAMQDLLSLIPTITKAEPGLSENDLAKRINLLEARATPRMLETLQFCIKSFKASREIDQEALDTLMGIYERVSISVKEAPVVKNTSVSMAPMVNVRENGQIEYSEVPRQALGAQDVEKLPDPAISSTDETYGSLGSSSSSSSALSQDMEALSAPATTPGLSSRDSFCADLSPPMPTIPTIQTKDPATGWRRNNVLTGTYMQWLSAASTDGVTFQGKTLLVTGAGKNSIGVEIIKMALTAGARIIVTTSSYSAETTAYYQAIYAQHSGRGSQLVVVPFNGGSQQDILNLVDYIYAGLGWDPDHVIPFAAVGEAGRAIDAIDSTSELAHRVMLTNVVRLLGAIKTQKAARRILTHPTQVILPLSPNHGIFGNDGLYAESKIGLEGLLNKWWSEDWGAYLSLCGTVIGWTRGTGLMAGNDVLAAGIEEMHVRTFSKTEMALHIAGLMASPVAAYCELEPLLADLSGGLAATGSLRAVLDQVQSEVNGKSEVRRAVESERAMDREVVGGVVPGPMKRKLNRRTRVRPDKYKLPDYKSQIEPLSAQLQGMVDLDRVAVVVGFGETGPYGNSRTRWEMETMGAFSVEGCLEMAWIMGLIKYHNGPLKGQDYCGWLESATGTPIHDVDVKARFEAHILAHTGIRMMEPRGHDDAAAAADPTHKQFLHEVAITEDLEPFEVSAETAQDFQREHGDKVTVTESQGQIYLTLRAGAVLMIPKATQLSHAVGAQLPTGWNARVYGIPDDIISQVDPVTLHTIVSTVEALLSAGITDPYELYSHMHVSAMAVCVGSGLGGVSSLHRMFKQRFLDRQVQKDVLAETFVNTTSAWVNMLLLGGSGPIRTPVGACATALESVDTGADLISNGRAKACLVGGFDGLEQDVAAEFANMQATVNVDKETAAGRTPREMSRPTTSSRGGFVEGEGCGVQLMTSARLALDMGLPIHGVVALTHTASDKIGRSVPAPGKGLLTIASEAAATTTTKLPSPMLNLAYRRRNAEMRRRQVEEKREDDLMWLEEKVVSQGHLDEAELNEYADECRREIEADAARSLKDILNTYGNGFWKGDARISPLRGALAVWGLTIDDLDVASLHGTSTVKNDLNESSVIQQELAHLGRARGNVLPCVSQKSLTGHAKGAAGAFALNGCFQIMATGTIPGNRNADNIDAGLEAYESLVFPNRNVQKAEIKAFSVTSFGFGQKGAQVIGVNPKYLFATIAEQEYEEYGRKVGARREKASRYFQDGFYGNKLVVLKDESPYKNEETESFLMNPDARL